MHNNKIQVAKIIETISYRARKTAGRLKNVKKNYYNFRIDANQNRLKFYDTEIEAIFSPCVRESACVSVEQRIYIYVCANEKQNSIVYIVICEKSVKLVKSFTDHKRTHLKFVRWHQMQITREKKQIFS